MMYGVFPSVMSWNSSNYIIAYILAPQRHQAAVSIVMKNDIFLTTPVALLMPIK